MSPEVRNGMASKPPCLWWFDLRYLGGVKRLLTGSVDASAVALGVGVGVWTSQLGYLSSCPRLAFCIIVYIQRFAAWESALFGLAATAILFVAGLVVSSGFRRTNGGLLRAMAIRLRMEVSR